MVPAQVACAEIIFLADCEWSSAIFDTQNTPEDLYHLVYLDSASSLSKACRLAEAVCQRG